MVVLDQATAVRSGVIGGGGAVGVCVIVKNEAPYLIEWLAHYLTLGFDRLLVYDNGSTDGTGELVRAIAAHDGRVLYQRWPDVAGEAPQLSAYRHALSRTKCEWMSFFDADELLVLRRHDRIREFLRFFPPVAGSVVVNWKLFGSSGQQKYVKELQAVRFTRAAQSRARTKCRFVKSIVRTGAVSQVGVHTCEISPPYRNFHADGTPATMLDGAKAMEVRHDVAQLNHYVVRSREEYEQKRARGNAARAQGDREKFGTRDEEFWETHDINECRDLAIKRWTDKAGATRSRLRRYLEEEGVHGVS